MRKKKDKKSSEPAEPAADEKPEATDVSPAEPETVEDEALETQLLRLRADFENFKRRVGRERSELYDRANEDLFNELLPVLDHFELGLKNAEEHHAKSAVMKGFKLVYDQLEATLKKFGVEPMVAEGKVFDPHRHEAVTHMPSEDQPADRVITETRRGYMIHDRLLRPAQVVVSSGSPVQEEKQPEADPPVNTHDDEEPEG